MKITHSHNYEVREGFKNRKPSMTVPGQAMSISQMLERLRHGMPVKLGQGFYFDPDEQTLIPQIKDLTDVEQAIYIANNADEIRRKIGEERAKKAANTVEGSEGSEVAAT